MFNSVDTLLSGGGQSLLNPDIFAPWMALDRVLTVLRCNYLQPMCDGLRRVSPKLDPEPVQLVPKLLTVGSLFRLKGQEAVWNVDTWLRRWP
jgi:hypothetical protein